MVTVEKAVLDARLAGLQTSVNNLVSQFAQGEITSSQLSDRRHILQNEYAQWYDTYTKSGATRQETEEIRKEAREQLARETQLEGEQIAYNLMLANKSGREYDVSKDMKALEAKHQSRYKWLQGDIIISQNFNAEYVTTFEEIPEVMESGKSVGTPYGFDRSPVPDPNDPNQRQGTPLTLEISEADMIKYQIQSKTVKYEGKPVHEDQPEPYKGEDISDFLGGGTTYLNDPESKEKAIREIVPTLTNEGIEDDGEVFRQWDDILTEISSPLQEAKEAQKTAFDKAYESNDLIGVGLAGAGHFLTSFAGGIFSGYTFAFNPVAWGKTGEGLVRLSTDPEARTEAVGQVLGDPIGFLGEVIGGSVGGNLFIRNVRSAKNILSGKTQQVVKGTGVEIYADDVVDSNVAKFDVNVKDISQTQAEIIKAELGDSPDALLLISKETDVAFDPMVGKHFGEDMARPQVTQFGDELLQEGLEAGVKGETIRIPKNLKTKLYQDIDELPLLDPKSGEMYSGVEAWKETGLGSKWQQLSVDDLESPYQQYYRSTGMTKDPVPPMIQGASYDIVGSTKIQSLGEVTDEVAMFTPRNPSSPKTPLNLTFPDKSGYPTLSTQKTAIYQYSRYNNLMNRLPTIIIPKTVSNSKVATATGIVSSSVKGSTKVGITSRSTSRQQENEVIETYTGQNYKVEMDSVISQSYKPATILETNQGMKTKQILKVDAKFDPTTSTIQLLDLDPKIRSDIVPINTTIFKQGSKSRLNTVSILDSQQGQDILSGIILAQKQKPIQIIAPYQPPINRMYPTNFLLEKKKKRKKGLKGKPLTDDWLVFHNVGLPEDLLGSPKKRKKKTKAKKRKKKVRKKK